jgi:hypothetical protein
MTQKKSTSARNRRPPTEIRITPESEKWLKERAESPEGQKLLYSLENSKFLEIHLKKLIKISPFDCEHASNVDQLFAEHATINQMVATPTGVQLGLRFTAFAHFVA